MTPTEFAILAALNVALIVAAYLTGASTGRAKLRSRLLDRFLSECEGTEALMTSMKRSWRDGVPRDHDKYIQLGGEVHGLGRAFDILYEDEK